MLGLLGSILVLAVGAIHVFIFNLEALMWYRGGAKGFGVKPDDLKVTSTFAANQGFYNLVLAVGCFYSLLLGDFHDRLFFMTAIVGCGIIGYLTTNSVKILQVQLAPAALALACLVLGDKQSTAFSTFCVFVGVAAFAGVSWFVNMRLQEDRVKPPPATK